MSRLDGATEPKAAEMAARLANTRAAVPRTWDQASLNVHYSVLFFATRID